MFNRDYFVGEYQKFIVVCKSSLGKKYIGPFDDILEANDWAVNSPYEDCKHKVVELFDPEIIP
jgi:hypothetical protein